MQSIQTHLSALFLFSCWFGFVTGVDVNAGASTRKGRNEGETSSPAGNNCSGVLHHSSPCGLTGAYEQYLLILLVQQLRMRWLRHEIDFTFSFFL